MCKVPSFCMGSAFGDVKTCIMKCIVFWSMSFLSLQQEWRRVSALVTGEIHFSDIPAITVANKHYKFAKMSEGIIN